MKHFFKIVFLIQIFFLTKFVNAQINWNQGGYAPSNIQIEPRRLPLEEMQRTGDILQERYDRNKNYRDELLKWIYELKSNKSDDQFKTALDVNYRKLRNMDDGAFHKLGDELSNIKNDIDYEIELYNKRYKERPKNLWDNGNEAFKQGNFAYALYFYNDLSKLSPEFAPLYLNRGLCLAKLNQNNEAINDINKYIEISGDKTNVRAYSCLGEVKTIIGDYKGSLESYNILNNLIPNTVSVLGGRAYAKLKLNDLIGSVNDYKKILEIEPLNTYTLNQIAWELFLQKKYSEALVYSNKSIKLDNTNSNYIDTRACIYYGLQNYSKALVEFNKALEINSELSNSYLYRGKVYIKLAKKKRACEDFNKAFDLGETDADILISKYCN